MPFIFIALGLILWFRKSVPEEGPAVHPKNSSRDMIREFISWDARLKLVTFLNFWIAFASGVVGFFLPIQIFMEGSGYVPVIIMGVVMALPSLMGWGLGKVFDQKGMRVFTYGISAFAVLLLGLAFAKSYLIQIIIGFLIGIIIEMLWIASEELMTTYSNPERFGLMDGISRSITDMGALIGPLCAGIAIDMFGTSITYISLAIIIVILAGYSLGALARKK